MRRWIPVGILVIVLWSGAGQAWGQTPAEVVAITTDAAERYGVNAATLLRILHCESRFDPHAVGDRGRSHGVAQLNDLPTGLLHHFRAVGYGSAYNAWEAVDYLARVAAGEWAREGITLRRWSCR